MPSKSGWILGGAVFACSLAYFGAGIVQQPFFADESAYFSQTHYFRLFVTGRWNHFDWIHPAAYDYMPIPKYLMGLALTATGQGGKIPTSTGAWEWWMSGHFDPPGDPNVLPVLRWLMAVGASFGCVAALTLGWQLVGPKTGLLAALLLGASPLYATHARRAMPDDLVQTFVLTSLCGFIAVARGLESRTASKRRVVVMILLFGIAGGFAVATKLNGVTGLLAIVLLGFACLLKPKMALSWKAFASTLAVAMVGAAAFVGINPYFFARPAMPAVDAPADVANIVGGRRRNPEAVEELRRVAQMDPIARARHMLAHRTESLAGAIDQFPNDALKTPWQRINAIVETGLGRFSAAGWLPLDWESSGLIALLFVLWGVLMSTKRGWREMRQGSVPVSWILVLWALAETAMLLVNLTLNWDRYYLGVVAWSSVLAAYAVGASALAVLDRLTLPPPTLEPAAPSSAPR